MHTAVAELLDAAIETSPPTLGGKKEKGNTVNVENLSEVQIVTECDCPPTDYEAEHYIEGEHVWTLHRIVVDHSAECARRMASDPDVRLIKN